MSFSCEFSSAFSSAFAICPTTPVAVEQPTLRGVPSAIPRPRRRPEVVEASGEGYIAVLGSGFLTGEAALRSELQAVVEGVGALVREALRVLVAAIRSGAESIVCGERAEVALASVAVGGVGAVCGELGLAVTGAYAVDARATVRAECFAAGRMPVRTGGEAVLTGHENDEALVLAASAWLRRYLTRKRPTP